MEQLYTIKNKIVQTSITLAEDKVPILKKSKINEGLLTPEEYVLAGNALVKEFSTWSWAFSKNNKKDYLPENKQFIIARGVPCVSKFLDIYSENINININIENELDASWEVCSSWDTLKIDNDVNKINKNISINGEYMCEKDIHKMDNSIINQNDFSESQITTKNNIILRSYDISITYDRFYQTPKIWIIGYDTNCSLLAIDEMYEDISPEYRNRTTTIEKHPFYDIPCISIHPCKHAKVMKSLISRSSTFTPDKYLFYFLNIIHSVIPSIEIEF